MLNFAFGSNMLLSRIRERTPSATSRGIALLRGYRLCWHKPSTSDGSGKCDLVQGVESDVAYGVLYEIAPHEESALDRAEGGYTRRLVKLEAGGELVEAWVYFAMKIDPSLQPFSWYKALVVSGGQ